MTFRPEDHTYWDDAGRRIPSVSEILRAGGLCGDYAHCPERDRERGRRVHLILEEIGKYGHSIMEIDDEVRPYIDSFQRFQSILGDDPRLCEVKAEGSDPIPYGGTVDLVWGGMLVDYKTSAPAPWHRVQLAAYGLALGTDSLAALYLRRDKPAVLRVVSMSEMDEARDKWRAACLAWRDKNG